MIATTGKDAMSMLSNKKATSVVATVTEVEWRRHRDDYDGLCLECGEWSSGGVEPDAENYDCESCESSSVVGAETALVGGWIKITERS